jgi:hypothetical protein
MDASMDAVTLNGTACANRRSGAYTNFRFIYACDGAIICIDKNG